MSAMASGSLQPTWYGHVTTARDALVLFEACLNGTLHHVPRRPHDRERTSLIKSGCVFIYEENASGIKRWTDGVPWSPSRILGNFLVYRELMAPFPPNEKKKAIKRNRRATRPGEPYPRAGSTDSPTDVSPVRNESVSESRETERALIGSLVDSYGFKEGGLVKKTMSVTLHGVQHHLVSYYRVEDVLDGSLTPPSKDVRLATIEPRAELIARQNFRAPLDDVEGGAAEHLPQASAGSYGYSATYRNPGLMVNGSTATSSLGLGLYGHLSYSSAGQMQAAMSTYAPTSASHAYYPSHHSIPQPLIPKQEDYSGYNHSYQSSQHNSPAATPERSHSLSQPPSSYGYRTSPVASGVVPRNSPTGLLDPPSTMADSKSSHNQAMWGRAASMSNVYGHSPAPTSNPSPSSYSTNGGQWNLGMGSANLALPRPEHVWSSPEAAASHWSVQNNPMTTRHTSYHPAPPLN